METLTCLAHTPALRRTGVGSSPAMWNFLDNAKLHVEDPSLAGEDFDYLQKIESEEDFAQAVAAAEAAAAEALKRLKRLMTIRTSSGTGSIGTRGRSSRRGAWVTAAATAATFESWTSQSSPSPSFNTLTLHTLACTEQSTRKLSVSSRVESLVAPRHYLCAPKFT